MKHFFNMSTPGLTQVQQQEMQFNAWTFHCCRIHCIAQIWLQVISIYSQNQRNTLRASASAVMKRWSQSAVRKWFQKQNTNFFKDGCQKLVQRWQKCVEVHGDFVEK